MTQGKALNKKMRQYKIVSDLKLHGFSAFGATEITPRMAIAYLISLDNVQEQLRQHGLENPQTILSELNINCMDNAMPDKWHDNLHDTMDDDDDEIEGNEHNTWATAVAARNDARFEHQTGVVLEEALSGSIGDYFMSSARFSAEPTEYGLLLHLSRHFLNPEINSMLQQPTPPPTPTTSPSLFRKWFPKGTRESGPSIP